MTALATITTAQLSELAALHSARKELAEDIRRLREALAVDPPPCLTPPMAPDDTTVRADGGSLPAAECSVTLHRVVPSRVLGGAYCRRDPVGGFAERWIRCSNGDPDGWDFGDATLAALRAHLAKTFLAGMIELREAQLAALERRIARLGVEVVEPPPSPVEAMASTAGGISS